MSLVLRGVRLPLAHFTLEIEATLSGRVTALFGPSGAGKTSVLEIIAGLRHPAAGCVSWGQATLTDVSAGVFLPPQRRAIGYVPQDGALFPHFSVRRNLSYGQAATGPADARLTFEHVVDFLEIGTLLDRHVGSLSGGEKQRVALGRALLSSPRLLLLDEPLAGLDTALKERLMPYLQRIRDEFRVPMLYVTHSAEEVMDLCDEVLVLAGGKRVTSGPPDALFVATGLPRYRRRD